MKRLKRWLMLIPITLALLLSVVKRKRDRLAPQGKNQNHSQGERNKAAKDAGCGTPVAGTLVEIPEAVIQDFNASRKAQTTQAQRQNKLTKWAVIGAWFYALIAALQLYFSERPYIGVLGSQLNAFTVGKPVEVTSTIENAGRTAATHCVPRGGIYTADPGVTIRWNHVAPNVSWFATFRTQIVVLPNRDYPARNASTWILTPEIQQAILNGKKLLGVVNAVEYLDDFLFLHRVRSCEMYFTQSNEFRFCEDVAKVK